MLTEEQALDFLSGASTGWDYFDTDWDNVDPEDFRYIHMLSRAYEERAIAAQSWTFTGRYNAKTSANLQGMWNSNVYTKVIEAYSLGCLISDIVNLGKFYVNHLYTNYEKQFLHYYGGLQGYYGRTYLFPHCFEQNWIFKQFPSIASAWQLVQATSGLNGSIFKYEYIQLIKDLKTLLCLYKYLPSKRMYVEFQPVAGANGYEKLSELYSDCLASDYVYVSSEGLKDVRSSFQDSSVPVYPSTDKMKQYQFLYSGGTDNWDFLGIYGKKEVIYDTGYGRYIDNYDMDLCGKGWNNCKLWKYLNKNANYTRISYTYDYNGLAISQIFPSGGTVNYTRNTFGLPFGFGITDLGAWDEQHHDFTIVHKNEIPCLAFPTTGHFINGCGCQYKIVLNYAVPGGFTYQ